MKQSQNTPSIFDENFIPAFVRNFSLFDDSAFPSTYNKEQNNISMWEDKNNIYLEANVPGMEENDLDITMDKNVIWIKGSKTETQDDQNQKYYYKASSNYSYRVTLPGSIDENQEPEVELKKGMLNFKFKKHAAKEQKKLKVNKQS